MFRSCLFLNGWYHIGFAALVWSVPSKFRSYLLATNLSSLLILLHCSGGVPVIFRPCSGHVPGTFRLCSSWNGWHDITCSHVLVIRLHVSGVNPTGFAPVSAHYAFLWCSGHALLCHYLHDNVSVMFCLKCSRLCSGQAMFWSCFWWNEWYYISNICLKCSCQVPVTCVCIQLDSFVCFAASSLRCSGHVLVMFRSCSRHVPVMLFLEQLANKNKLQSCFCHCCVYITS